MWVRLVPKAAVDMLGYHSLFPRPDESPPDDAQQVMTAAEILRVREIDLFRLAWRDWHGAPGDARVIEAAFAQYMFHKTVPPWVRHFARSVLDGAERGQLLPQPHGVVRRRPEPPVTWPGPVYVGLVMAITLLFIATLSATPGDGNGAAALVCDGGAGLRHIFRLAYMTSDVTPPDCP